MACVDVLSLGSSFSSMCGISGIWERNGCRLQDLKRRASAMTQTLSHRGPDDSGVWLGEQASIAFGQRRLAIIDLSPTGHQPMVSANGQYAITFNGEIYNFRELRAECGELRSSVSRAFRYRSYCRRIRPMGRQIDHRSLERDVRNCSVGRRESVNCSWLVIEWAKSRSIGRFSMD